MSVHGKVELVVNVELDDRSVLFPAGKFLTHVVVQGGLDERLRLEAKCLFNEAREDTEIAVLDLDDAHALGRAMVEAVFQGRTQHVLSPSTSIAVIFNPNGFVIAFGEGASRKELFLASPAILRLAQGVLRVADRLEARLVS